MQELKKIEYEQLQKAAAYWRNETLSTSSLFGSAFRKAVGMNDNPWGNYLKNNNLYVPRHVASKIEILATNTTHWRALFKAIDARNNVETPK